METPELGFLEADGIMNIGPCLVGLIAIAADGANADVDVYDGTNANGTKKAHLEALSGTTSSLPFKDYVRFHKGIYVDVNATTTKVMIEYLPTET